jgi:hypothetical protein
MLPTVALVVSHIAWLVHCIYFVFLGVGDQYLSDPGGGNYAAVNAWQFLTEAGISGSFNDEVYLAAASLTFLAFVLAFLVMGYLCSCCNSCCCRSCCNCRGFVCVVVMSVFGLLFDLIAAILMMQPLVFTDPSGRYAPVSYQQSFTWGVLGPAGGLVCFFLIILLLTLDRFYCGNKYAAKEEPGTQMTSVTSGADRA